MSTVDYEILNVSDLSPDEKDTVMELMLHHIGRAIQASKWEDSAQRSLDLIPLDQAERFRRY